MQRSNVFVLYRAIPEGDDEQLVYYAAIDKRADVQNPATDKLADAMRTTKAHAFSTALDDPRGGPWSVGEIVSDKSGTRVDQ